MRDFIKNNRYILLSEILVLIVFCLFYGKFGDIIVDSYREVYIPQEMLDGKVIYKDIFVIYSPLSYMMNAFLMKITTLHNAALLSFAGLFSTMGILYFTYKIANLYLYQKYSFCINLFIISAFVLSPNVFNPFLPYSFGILYGILFILIALYLALNKRFPLSYLFCSLAILNRYEFIFLLPLLILWSKKQHWKQNLLAFISPIALTGGVLYLQGLRIDDVVALTDIINTMTGTKTLYWFYSVTGLTWRAEHIMLYLAGFFKFLIPVYWVRYQEILVWACPVILVGTCIRFTNLKKTEIFFLLSTLFVALKVFFALTLQSYGVYFLPFVLISLFIVIPDKLKKYFCLLLIIWSFIIGGLNVNALIHKKNDLPAITKYIQEHTSKDDRVVIYPEGLFLNVKTDRKSDDKFYSLIPLYVETFGEEIIIKRLEKVPPKYIIISDYDTSAYYFKEFGIDYAKDIFLWIKHNYKLQKVVDDKWKFRIYQLK